MELLKENANKGKALYKSGIIEREEAMEMIMPYIDEFNAKSIEIAKKFNMKPKKISFAQFLRN